MDKTPKTPKTPYQNLGEAAADLKRSIKDEIYPYLERIAGWLADQLLLLETKLGKHNRTRG